MGAALICDAAIASIDGPRAETLKPIETTARANDDSARASDEALRQRVQSALHADPYFYDRHVTVSVKNGHVTLKGFVFSAWDLTNALKIARDASGGAPVEDHLTIQENKRR
jgi:osmotically-inducible protein OsmY